MTGGIAGDKAGKKRKLYTHDEYYEMLDTDWPYDDDSTSEDAQMLAMVDQWLGKPQQNILNDSESDDEPPLEHVGVFVEGLRRDNEGLYDSEISQSPESTDSETCEDDQTSEEISNFVTIINREAQSIENKNGVSENARISDMNSENVENSNRNSESAANLETHENADINVHMSEGVRLERLREIISSQDRPSNALGHIAALRRNCLRNDDE